MKILHVLNYSLPNLNGYTIRSKYIVEFQKTFGLIPLVVTSTRHEQKDPAIQREVIYDITYFRTDLSDNIISAAFANLPYIKEYLYISRLRHRINEIILDNKLSIIHAHTPSLCGLAASSSKFRKKFDIPLVYEIRALFEDAAVESGKFSTHSAKYKISRKVENIVFKNADRIVAISQGLKDDLVKRGIPEGKIYIVPNGVDTNIFIPMEKDDKIADRYQLKDKIIIGYIGSFFKFEGLAYLLQAFPMILHEIPNTTLLLVGDGEDRIQIEKLSKELGVEKNVVFTGNVPHEEILKYYSVFDIMIYPRVATRLTEIVTPLKPLEAMSMEKAVIASNVGGLKELIISGEYGILFESENVRDLANKCIDLAKDKEARFELGKKARQYVVEYRDWSKIVPLYLDVYQFR